MSARCNHVPFEMYINIIPVIEAGNDGFIRCSIRSCKIIQRLIGEDHAPAKGIPGPIALHHRDPRLWSRLLHKQRKIQPRWPSANTYNMHKPCSLGLERTSHKDSL